MTADGAPPAGGVVYRRAHDNDHDDADSWSGTTGLRVQLFGRFRVACGEHALTGLGAQKAQELFSYLLLHREQAHRRGTLASVLWCDASAGQAQKYLRQSLWQLQSALDQQPQASDVLLIEGDWIRLNVRVGLWLDAAVYEAAAGVARDIPGYALSAQVADYVNRAVQLYTGDLLDGWFQDWCLYERERFQSLYLTMLDKLMSYCEARGEWEAGVSYGARILHIDRARERAHQRLMRLHHLSGDRAAALRQFERCAAALREELGVRPTRRTLELYEQIRADRLEPPIPPQTPGNAPAELVEFLKRIRAELQDVVRAVDREIGSSRSASGGIG
jgi:DNA-binding SARP family transcriptional activator